jgi:signal transduction histidine kinase
MRAGAHDYLMKGNLARLAPAVEREIREARQRMAIERLAANGRMAARCAHIVRQVFDLYRTEPELPREFDVVAAVRDVTDRLAPGCREQGIVIHRGLPDEPLRVPLPRNSLVQVLFNIVQNAIEASPAGGTVTVALVPEEGRLEFAASDQGPGIPPGIGNRIFEPFFTTKEDERSGGGLGLGLAISREIMASLGGTLDYNSTSAGTTFRIVVPLAVGAQTAP